MKQKLPELPLAERCLQYQEELENLTMMSDAFMRVVLKEKACTEYILQIIMGKADLKIIDQVIQKDYKNLQGRSSILDCVAQDNKGSIINIEVQQGTQDAVPKRARYHSGLIDMNTLKRGQHFKDLPVSYVIFITGSDVLGYKLPIYHIRRIIEENGACFEDETHILYVDSSKQDDSALGHLMHDLNCKSASKIYSPVLAKRVRELKETEEGVKIMCEVMDRIYNWGEQIGEQRGIRLGEERGIQLGEERGRADMQRETTLNLVRMGLSIDQIALAVHASTSAVQDWIRSAEANPSGSYDKQ